MALAMGTGPFGRRPAGRFNFEPGAPHHVLYFEDSPRRVTVVFNGEAVACSERTQLLHESGHTPVYYFPEDDVSVDLMEPTDKHTTCPVKGEASYRSLVVGDRRADNAVWAYPDPVPGAEWLAGHVAFYWDAVDHWYEEDEEIFVHPRDPYHRVDVAHSSREVRVSVDGETVAASTRPVMLYETALPTRYYLPREDVTADLTPTDTTSGCPYKGRASYWAVQAGRGLHRDLAWTYEEPNAAFAAIAGRVAFYNERVDITLDGRTLERPQTPFS